jgi:hypothetical protein
LKDDRESAYEPKSDRMNGSEKVQNTSHGPMVCRSISWLRGLERLEPHLSGMFFSDSE